MYLLIVILTVQYNFRENYFAMVRICLSPVICSGKYSSVSFPKHEHILLFLNHPGLLYLFLIIPLAAVEVIWGVI